MSKSICIQYLQHWLLLLATVVLRYFCLNCSSFFHQPKIGICLSGCCHKVAVAAASACHRQNTTGNYWLSNSQQSAHLLNAISAHFNFKYFANLPDQLSCNLVSLPLLPLSPVFFLSSFFLLSFSTLSSMQRTAAALSDDDDDDDPLWAIKTINHWQRAF